MTVPITPAPIPVATPTLCLRCGRALTSPLSVAVGLGPGCTRHIRLTVPTLTGYSDQQLEDALELLELGGLTPLRGRRVWLTVGHRGATYRTAVTGHCTCVAGLYGKPCHHAAAVHLVAA
ncbi:hypothetical protein BBK14_08665 [Parafrankia soli]|uniref:SWIM-type domain-containing protein n=1 Tax=Parafrankia soli TaxID=2599596 RepID=A0A1S1PBR1_9ACTN|nr:DUF6011 domain-containing protein [Parafrankia soli]OHV20288.1 hypothetical protein BBK14_08665 [Parafrankia soli]